MLQMNESTQFLCLATLNQSRFTATMYCYSNKVDSELPSIKVV